LFYTVFILLKQSSLIEIKFRLVKQTKERLHANIAERRIRGRHKQRLHRRIEKKLD